MFKIFRSKAFLLAIGWIFVVNAIALIGLNRLNMAPDDAYSWIPTEKYNQDKSWNIINFHSRWDSNWYLDIVEKGYEKRIDDTLSNIVFFPLYPALVKTFSLLLGGNAILAGGVVSLLFLILSCQLLYKLVKKHHKESDPLFSVFLLLIFPTAFFLNCVYTESLFIFLSLAVFYFTFEKKYLFAGLIGFLASLTRVTGVLLFLPMLIQIFIQEKDKARGYEKYLSSFLIPFGTGLFFLYHWIVFGDPLLFFEVQSAWGRSFSVNLDHFILFSSASQANFLLDFFYIVFVLFVIGYFFKSKKYAYAVYMLSTVGVALASGTAMSIGRYILVLFPIYILGASLKNEIARYSWVLISAMLMALNTFLFAVWYWAG
jgi:hypothetical protein